MENRNAMPDILKRDPADLIVFVNWMRRRTPYRCACGTLWSGLYKPVYCCPHCGRKVSYDDKSN